MIAVNEWRPTLPVENWITLRTTRHFLPALTECSQWLSTESSTGIGIPYSWVS